MKQILKKATAFALAAALIGGAMPFDTGNFISGDASIVAHAESEWAKSADNTTLGTSGIGVPNSSSTGAWQGSYVYYGKYNNNPVKYRVLDPHSTDFKDDNNRNKSLNTLFLDCNSILTSGKWGTTNTNWGSNDCNLRNWLNGNSFLTSTQNFTSVERNSIPAVYKTYSTNEMGNYFIINITNHEQVFPLDMFDVYKNEYGYSSNGARAKSSTINWWLRTRPKDSIASHNSHAATITNEGGFSAKPVGDTHGYSPAFNVLLDDIILASKVNPANTGTYGNEYKLTLKDSNTTVTTGTIYKTGRLVTVPYTVTDTKANDGITAERVSVLITDKDYTASDAVIKYYGALSGTYSANGTGTFELPDNYNETDKIYVLAEDVNSQYVTDYASAPVEIEFGTLKQLKVGKFIEVGDIVDFGEKTYFWPDDDRDYNLNEILYCIGKNKVTKVSYHSANKQYYFDLEKSFYNADDDEKNENYDAIFITSEVLDPDPTGFYVTGGSGTENDPFTFGLSYNSVKGTSVTLGGELGLNFYVSVSDVDVNAGSKAVMNGFNGEQEVTLSSLPKNSDGLYKLSYPVRAVDTSNEVTLQIVNANGDVLPLFNTSGTEYSNDTMTHSVSAYLKSAVNRTDISDADKEKIRATATYCAYSEKWYNNTAVPEDETLINQLPNITADDLTGYKLVKTGTAGDFKVVGYSLVLDANTAFKLYFTVANNSLEGHTVKIGTQTVTPVKTNQKSGELDMYYVEVADIGANELKTTHTVTFDDNYEVTFSAMTYVYYAIKNQTKYDFITEDVVNVVKAIYAYAEMF